MDELIGPFAYPRCRNCGRRIEDVDGVGWLHPDDRIYFVPQLEPKCENAEPGTGYLRVERSTDG